MEIPKLLAKAILTAMGEEYIETLITPEGKKLEVRLYYGQMPNGRKSWTLEVTGNGTFGIKDKMKEALKKKKSDDTNLLWDGTKKAWVKYLFAMHPKMDFDSLLYDFESIGCYTEAKRKSKLYREEKLEHLFDEKLTPKDLVKAFAYLFHNRELDDSYGYERNGVFSYSVRHDANYQPLRDVGILKDYGWKETDKKEDKDYNGSVTTIRMTNGKNVIDCLASYDSYYTRSGRNPGHGNSLSIQIVR